MDDKKHFKMIYASNLNQGKAMQQAKELAVRTKEFNADILTIEVQSEETYRLRELLGKSEIEIELHIRNAKAAQDEIERLNIATTFINEQTDAYIKMRKLLAKYETALKFYADSGCADCCIEYGGNPDTIVNCYDGGKTAKDALWLKGE